MAVSALVVLLLWTFPWPIAKTLEEQRLRSARLSWIALVVALMVLLWTLAHSLGWLLLQSQVGAEATGGVTPEPRWKSRSQSNSRSPSSLIVCWPTQAVQHGDAPPAPAHPDGASVPVRYSVQRLDTGGACHSWDSMMRVASGFRAYRTGVRVVLGRAFGVSSGRSSANDPKLSDGRGWRGPCMVGGEGRWAGSTGRDSRARSLQRMVRRSFGLACGVAQESGHARPRRRRPNHSRQKAGNAGAHGSHERRKPPSCRVRSKHCWRKGEARGHRGATEREPRDTRDRRGA